MFPARTALLLAALLAVPAGARAADLDPLVPADTESYLSVHVRQVLDAEVVKKHLLKPARNFLENELGDLNAVLKELGFDPFRQLDRVVVASPGGADRDRGLIIAHGTFDPAKVKAKADAAARDNADKVKLHKVPLGKGMTHPVYEIVLGDQDESMFLALVSNKTLVASPGKDYVVEALKQAGAKKKAALKNKEFQALVEKLDPRQSVSLAVLGKSLVGAGGVDGLPKVVTNALGRVEAVGGGLTVGNEVKLDLLVAGKSEANAKAVREALDRGVKLALVGLALVGEENRGLGLVLEVVKTVKVTGKGKQVGVSARLTADVLQDFFAKDG